MNNPENYHQIKCCHNCSLVFKTKLGHIMHYECSLDARDEDGLVEVEADYTCDLWKAGRLWEDAA